MIISHFRIVNCKVGFLAYFSHLQGAQGKRESVQSLLLRATLVLNVEKTKQDIQEF